MAMIIGLLLAGLWPFEFSPRNRASWIPEGNGLYFGGQKRFWIHSVGSLAYSRPLTVSSAWPPAKKGEWTIAIEVRPANSETDGIPHFLSMTNKSGEEILYLGQWKTSLIMGWSGSRQESPGRRRNIIVGEALSAERARRLTITSDQTGTAIYVDGALAKRFPEAIVRGEEDTLRGCRIMLGNSPSGRSPWTGTILALALFERSLTKRQVPRTGESPGDESKDFDVPSAGGMASFNFRGGETSLRIDLSGNGNAFVIPARIVFEKRLLAWPGFAEHNSVSMAEDIVANLLGFVPLGFFFSLWLFKFPGWKPRRAYALVILLGGFISLGIETTQAFMPARDSSLLDLLGNISGTLMGVLIFHLLHGSAAARARGRETSIPDH